MRRLLLTIVPSAGLAALMILAATAAHGQTLWTDFRTSALQPGDQITVRIENPQGPGFVNTVLFAAGTIEEAPLAAIVDGPSTVSALVPGPVDQRRYYGFRLVAGAERDLLPVRLADGVAVTPGLLSLVATDPVGDEVFGRPHLDLVECRVSFTSTHLHAALRNASGGFPVSQSLTFFSYLFGLSDPADPDPEVVWALLHTVTAAGIIEPGLYRVEGTGTDDLVPIGTISVQEFPAQNTLVLSCLLADLLGDPPFAAWFAPDDPRVGVGAFTQRITILGGPQEADRIEGGRVHLRALSRDPGPNTLPQLSDLTVAPPGPGAVAEVVYVDADGHCPVLAELVVTGPGGQAASYPLLPQTLDYGGAVLYRSVTGIPALVAGDWTEVEARFSDDAVTVVTESLAVTGIADGGAGVAAQLRLDAAPNPFTGQTVFNFRLPASGAVRLSVHDLKGRTVAVLIDGERPAGHHAAIWDGRDQRSRRQPAGVYVYRLQTPQGALVQRVTLVR
jgi:hypothetical protein